MTSTEPGLGTPITEPARRGPVSRGLRQGPYVVMLICGLTLMAGAIAGVAVGIHGVTQLPDLPDAAVSLSTTWEDDGIVSHTGDLTAGLEYAICAGPDLKLDDISVFAGASPDTGTQVPVRDAPDRADLAPAYTFGIVTCDLRAVFTPVTSGTHTIVYQSDPLTSWATGLELAQFAPLRELQPAIDQRNAGFTAALPCAIVGLPLVIIAAYQLRARRQARTHMPTH